MALSVTYPSARNLLCLFKSLTRQSAVGRNNLALSQQRCWIASGHHRPQEPTFAAASNLSGVSPTSADARVSRHAAEMKTHWKTVTSKLNAGKAKLDAQLKPPKQNPTLKKPFLSSEALSAMKKTFVAATMACAAVVTSKTAAAKWKSVTPEDCAFACESLLKSVVRTPFKTYRAEGLYTIELEPPSEDAPKLVLLHGYGSGSGLWAFNLDTLARDFHVFAVDWRGCGASDRPDFAAATVEEGERWFTESLEAWRAAVGVSSAVFVGHSLGGYLCGAYALHHPHRISHLVLVSPAGIPVPPDPEMMAKRRSHWVYGLLKYAWENNVTPQGIVRALGPFGEKWASDIITRRFKYMLAAHEDQQRTFDEAAFVKYLYQITAADGSGEYALNVLLAFGAHAREPMGPRLIHAADVGEEPEPADAAMDAAAEAGAKGPHKARPHRFITPTTMIYGGSWDWMPADAGFHTCEELRKRGIDAATYLVPQSGHHLYMEQPDMFVDVLRKRLLRS